MNSLQFIIVNCFITFNLLNTIISANGDEQKTVCWF